MQHLACLQVNFSPSHDVLLYCILTRHDAITSCYREYVLIHVNIGDKRIDRTLTIDICNNCFNFLEEVNIDVSTYISGVIVIQFGHA